VQNVLIDSDVSCAVAKHVVQQVSAVVFLVIERIVGRYARRLQIFGRQCGDGVAVVASLVYIDATILSVV
jgi:hypothetical protein